MEEINMIGKEVNSIKGKHYITGKYIEVKIKDNYIHDIQEVEQSDETNKVIAPGFVDIQINGYKGYDFNYKALTRQEWEQVISELIKVGVTTFYPTIISNSINQLSTIFKKNVEVINSNKFNSFIGGFHLEGPYLSKEEGARGAHEKKYIKAPNWDEFCRLQEDAQGKIKIITVSPEWSTAKSFIKKATASGVKVAIGHTAANSKQIKDAVDAGAILSTHLGNGTHVTLPRHPNYIWDQLAEKKLWASIIADGHHLPKSVLNVFNQVKNNKMILVSDSVALAGCKSGNYNTTIGGEVTLTSHGKLHLKNNHNLLAGSALSLLQCVEYCVRSRITSLEEGINKASIYPATLMDLPVQQGLNIGSLADLIVINQVGENLKIIETIKSGMKLKPSL